eukprot:403356063
MDKRTYLSKLIEPNEQYFQLLIDIMMYSKYKILIDDSAANDFSLVDMLKKTKASIIRLLHQQEFKAAVAQLSVAEEIKVQKQCQASTAQDTYSALGYQTNNTISSITKTEKADQPSQLLINEYDNMESNFMQEPALDEENFTNLREYLQYKDFNRKAGFEDSQNGNKPGSIDNFSQQANYSFEIGQQKAQSAQVLIKMLQYLTMIGAMLMQVGASVECEECYTYYISIMESIQGKNTLKIGQAYYLMGMYYDDQQSFNKSLICYMKTLEIYKGHLGETHRSVGDCFYQIAVLFKHQNSFLKLELERQSKIQELLQLNQQKDVQKQSENKISNADKQEQDKFMSLIAESLQKQQIKKVTDFVDEKVIPKNQLEKLFQKKGASIDLDQNEMQLIQTFSFILTLNSQQKHMLSDQNKVENIIPYLDSQFLQSLDSLQVSLLLDSGLQSQKLDHLHIEQIETLVHLMNKKCRNLMERSSEEREMEQMLIDIIQSDKIKAFNLQFQISQLKAFENIMKLNLPMKFLLYMMDARQKRVILEFLFVAIFSDNANDEANECFQMFSLYIWYFHLFDEPTIDEMKLICDDQTYQKLVLNLYMNVNANEKAIILQINEKIVNQLSFEQLLTFKQLKINPMNIELSKNFISTLNQRQCFSIYSDFIKSTRNYFSIKRALQHIPFSTKYIFQFDIKSKQSTQDRPSDINQQQYTKEDLIMMKINQLQQLNDEFSPAKFGGESGIQEMIKKDIGDNFGLRFLSSNYEELLLMRDINQLNLIQQAVQNDSKVIRHNESMKNLSKDSINNTRKQLDDSSVLLSVYSKEGLGFGSGALGQSVIHNKLTDQSMRSIDTDSRMNQLNLFNFKNDSFRGGSLELDESVISTRSFSKSNNQVTKRVSQGFDSFKKKNNMLVEEELRVFVSIFQKRDPQITFEKLKKSFTQMDEPLIDFMRIYVQEQPIISDYSEDQSLSIVDYEKLKQQVPRLLTRVNTLLLEIHMMPLMKEIETNCNLVIEATSEICQNQVIVEKTITDIYNFIQRNKNQVSYIRPLAEMLNNITSQSSEKFINDVSIFKSFMNIQYAFQRLDIDEYVRILNTNFESLIVLSRNKPGNAIDEMSKNVQNFRIKIRELEINLQAAFKDGDSQFCRKFTKLPKKGLKLQEKSTEKLAKTKEELKKLDQVFKAPQNINGSIPYNEINRYENMIAFFRLIELINKTIYFQQ